MNSRCLSAGTLGLVLAFSLACAGDAVAPLPEPSIPSETCSASPEQAAAHFLTLLPEALPTRWVRPHFSCTPEGLVGRVDVDAIHREQASDYLASWIDPQLEALKEADWHRVEVDVRHLPGDLDITAAFLGHQTDPMRSLRPLVTARSQFVLDAMGPRTTTTPEPGRPVSRATSWPCSTPPVRRGCSSMSRYMRPSPGA